MGYFRLFLPPKISFVVSIFMKNFWIELVKPFWILAPMEDVTDTVFRQIIATCGAPDVFFSEFVNVKGLKYEMENPEVGQIVSHRLLKTLEKELHKKPIVAQIWGITPEDYRQSAAKIVELGFDGIDINMGCPVKNVTSQGACSALIKNPTLAAEIIRATQEGSGGLIPVSVKTRIGFDRIDTENWASFLLSQNLQALTIHGRTVKEESKVPCHWDEIGKFVAINNQIWRSRNEKTQNENQIRSDNQVESESSFTKKDQENIQTSLNLIDNSNKNFTNNSSYHLTNDAFNILTDSKNWQKYKSQNLENSPKNSILKLDYFKSPEFSENLKLIMKDKETEIQFLNPKKGLQKIEILVKDQLDQDFPSYFQIDKNQLNNSFDLTNFDKKQKIQQELAQIWQTQNLRNPEPKNLQTVKALEKLIESKSQNTKNSEKNPEVIFENLPKFWSRIPKSQNIKSRNKTNSDQKVEQNEKKKLEELKEKNSQTLENQEQNQQIISWQLANLSEFLVEFID